MLGLGGCGGHQGLVSLLYSQQRVVGKRGLSIVKVDGGVGFYGNFGVKRIMSRTNTSPKKI